MLPAFAKDTVKRIRPTMVNKRGTAERSWLEADTAEIKRCSFQLTSTSSDFSARYHTQVDAKLFVEDGADIKANDRIEFDGEVYEVVGVPLLKRGATGNLRHKEVLLVRYKG